jgi:hypothetical protein
MSKLQMIKRANSTESYSANIPLAMIKDLGWIKGDFLLVELIEKKIVISKGEQDGRD